jgi:hypothetical protein
VGQGTRDFPTSMSTNVPMWYAQSHFFEESICINYIQSSAVMISVYCTLERVVLPRYVFNKTLRECSVRWVVAGNKAIGGTEPA